MELSDRSTHLVLVREREREREREGEREKERERERERGGRDEYIYKCTCVIANQCVHDI